MATIFDQARDFFEPLTLPQRAIFGMLMVIIVVFLVFMFRWIMAPDYSLLFGSLHPDSAKEIVSELDDLEVPYKIEESGRAIYVPTDQVHELRMKLASKSFNQPNVQGYELFDSNTLGMTDFMQQVNKKRALEGELARSINSLQQVEFSRVHLVLPERSAFQQSNVAASASVLLTVKQGQRLTQPQIEGISSLIAGSVEGLDASGVTILDQNGNRLSDATQGDGDYASGNTHMQLRQKTESYLTERGQTMLDRVLGPGNSIIRVAIEHDFDRIIRESDTLDPDTRIVMSEERRNDAQTDQTFQPVGTDEFTPIAQRGQTMLVGTRDNQQTVQSRSYDINRTREVFEKSPGEIRRISASVLLNYKKSDQTNADGQPIFVPYTQQEINDLQNVVRNALGLQPGRGDEMSITQIQFYDPLIDAQYQFGNEAPLNWNEMIRYGIIMIALLTVVFLMYNMSRRLPQNSLEKSYASETLYAENQVNPDQEPSRPVIDENDLYQKKLSESARKQLSAKANVVEEIKEFVKNQSDEASNVVRAMMQTTK
jgi:flagellar M-ring protein FliF